jgi:predicted GNAT family acetyltransferase
MHVIQYNDAKAFATDAMDMLMRAEAQNNLIIGRTLRFIEKGLPEDVLLIGVRENGACVAAAMMTPPHRLVITDASSDAVDVVARWIHENQIPIPGFCGPAGAVKRFAEAWRGDGATLHRSLRIFQLDRVTAPKNVSGSFHAATRDDLQLIQDWCEAFAKELGEPDRGVRERSVQLVEDGHFHTWKDPQIVSMAAWAGPTPNGIRINAVYTPSEFRNRGYASACVAALSQKLLDDGRKFCFLYTDLANPTSNSIYRKIGYRAVCDWSDYLI